MNKENTQFGYGSEFHDIVAGIRDLLREASNTAQMIDTTMQELDAIRKMQKSEAARKSKGEYELDDKKGTIYDKFEADILKNILGAKTEYWNPNWDFISWEELFSKINLIDSILDKIETKKEEFENILVKSSEIKTRLISIYTYLP